MTLFRHWRLAMLVLGAGTACLDQVAPGARPLIEISPPWAVLGPGDTLRLSALLTDSASGPVTADWTTQNATVVQVDSTGRLRAIGTGTTTVTARRGARFAEAVVAVVPAVLVGAGDIADCGLQGDEATSAIVRNIPGFVFTSGDNAYQNGSPRDYADCYDPSWGQFRVRTRPTPGAHDYLTPDAAGYFGYFGPAAGTPGLGYYSFRAGMWHVVALNTNIPIDSVSPQLTWLRQELLANPARCVAAYAYRPRFSSGRHGSADWMQSVWEALYDTGAEIFVAGHDHIYERFAPQTPTGEADTLLGIRQFTVGTGGGLLTTVAARLPNSEVVRTGRNGVLKLVLGDSTYRWEFLTAPGGQVADSGTGRCH